MMRFQKPAEFYEGLRLHQNENTGGCSPRVLEALAGLTPQQIGFYPPYEQTTRAVASYLGKGQPYDRAIADFSATYADQNERDYATFAQAVKSGRISAHTGL